MPTARTLPRWSASSRFALASVAAATASIAGGCYFAGGPGWSADRFTYPSDSWRPQTVSLVDTRTGETLWSVDVPVGQQLVVGFYADRNEDDPMMPDEMQWRIMKAGKRFGPLHNRMPCPPRDARLVEVTMREAPELPGAVLPPGGPDAPAEVFEPVTESPERYDDITPTGG